MASLLPSRTLPLTLVLMVLLAPGAAGLCHLGGGGLGLDGAVPLCLPDSERGAHLASREWGLPMAVTGHWSLKPSATEPSAHSCPRPGPGGRAAWGRAEAGVGVRLGPLDLQVCRVPSFCSPRLPPGGRTSKGPCSANGPQAVFNISSLSGLLSPALTESLLVALPPCHLTGGNATLTVRRANDSTVVTRGFVVPPCRGRRELVSVVDSGAGFTVTRLSAYQVTNLAPGTKYYVSYRVRKGTATESSREVPMSTLPRRKGASIGLGMARTGGMVVITVLLSVAMFLLVVGFVVALALGARK